MAKKSAKTKKPMTRSQLAVTLVVAILIMVGANLVLFLSTPSSSNKTGKAALFGVKEIVVEGNTRYDEEAIVGVSGITVGQSIFSVDKKQAAENIRSAFPYAESVTVDNKDSMDTIRIAIQEARPLGVMAVDGEWMLVSTTGRGLATWEKQSDKPLRYLYLKGTSAQELKVGGQVLDERSLSIATTLIDTLREHEIEGITEIDMTNKADIRVNWENRITFLLGNDSNLEHKLAAIASTLPLVEKDHGEDARGTLNVRDYSDGNAKNSYIVFRPEGLVTTTTSSRTSSTSGTTASSAG